MIQAQAVMGNEISKTEIIEVTDDNDTRGGVNDAANDRDRYEEDKWVTGMRNRRQSLQKPSVVTKE